MQLTNNEDSIAGIECRHIVRTESPDRQHDLLTIKEWIHYKDGRVVPNLRFIEDYKRHFWVTKKNFRVHNDKREREKIERLQRFTTTQCKLTSSIARALGNPGFQPGLKVLARSPYLYGADITTPVLLKKLYHDKWPNLEPTDATVAVLDIETDVLLGTGEILSVALTFKDRAVIAVTQRFLGTTPDAENKIQRMFVKLLKDDVDKRKIKLDVVIAESPGHACAEVIKRAHEWGPDIVAIWNMDYDLPYIYRTLESEGYDLASTFSDPLVPYKYKYFHYKQGLTKRSTEKGEVPIHPADQWHTATFPAKWYVLDAMCVYKNIRTVSGNEPNYTLDGVLSRNIKRTKLKIDGCSHLTGLSWHQVMQKEHKVEYLIYNLFDCIGVELLDEQTGDLAKSFNVLAGISEYKSFTSNPKRINDDLHYFNLDDGHVIGTTSDQMSDELNKYVVGMDDWIVTLPSYLVEDSGMKVISELPSLKSLVRAHVADLDVTGAYPTEEEIFNISKSTTLAEVFQIVGLSDKQRREVGINLSGGCVNAIHICTTVFNYPTSKQLLQSFKN